jgi:hypothetical protein
MLPMSLRAHVSISPGASSRTLRVNWIAVHFGNAANCSAHSTESVLHPYGWKDGDVELVQVDVVGAESSERIFTRLPDVRRGHVPPDDAPVVFVDDSTELRSENNPVAAIVCRNAKHLLSVAGSVHVGHVEEVDALVHRRVDRADRLVVVHRPPTCLRPLQQEGAADGPTAKPHSRHFDVRSAGLRASTRLRSR